MILTRKPNPQLQKEIKNIKNTQRDEDKINRLIKKIESGSRHHEFTLRDGDLYKSKIGHKKLVLTRDITLKLIKEVHELFGNIGGLKCFKLISEDFFLPKIKKTYTQNNRAMSHPINPEGPNELVSIDFVGPLPISQGGAKYLFVAMDAFTKYVQLYPIKKADTRITIKKTVGLFDIFFFSKLIAPLVMNESGPFRS